MISPSSPHRDGGRPVNNRDRYPAFSGIVRSGFQSNRGLSGWPFGKPCHLSSANDADGKGRKKRAASRYGFPVIMVIFLFFQVIIPFRNVAAHEEKRALPNRRFDDPADPLRLERAVDTLLSDAVAPMKGRPLALISPHANLAFSGQICADAFQQAAGHDYDLVVLIGGPPGPEDFQGISLFPENGYPTPLGIAPVDTPLAERLVKAPSVRWAPAPHWAERSVGGLVPFVQILFPETPILPVIMETRNPAICIGFGKTLARHLKGRQPLIVASTNLSQKTNPSAAIPTDRETLRTMTTLDPRNFAGPIHWTDQEGSQGKKRVGHACAVMATLSAACELGATYGHIVSYVHSGDTALGKPERVTGFGAVAFFEASPCRNDLPGPPIFPSSMALTAENREVLMTFARRTLRQYLATGIPPLARPSDPALSAHRGVRVTLKRAGRPRGIGVNWKPDRPLLRQVVAQTLQAAFGDPQFPPLRPEELKDTEIDIFVLTPSRDGRTTEILHIGKGADHQRWKADPVSFRPAASVEGGRHQSAPLGWLLEKIGLFQGGGPGTKEISAHTMMTAPHFAGE